MQLNKLKLGGKSGTEVILKNSLNVVGNSNNENSFNHQLLLTFKNFWGFVKFLQIIPQLS